MFFHFYLIVFELLGIHFSTFLWINLGKFESDYLSTSAGWLGRMFEGGLRDRSVGAVEVSVRNSWIKDSFTLLRRKTSFRPLISQNSLETLPQKPPLKFFNSKLENSRLIGAQVYLFLTFIFNFQILWENIHNIEMLIGFGSDVGIRND